MTLLLRELDPDGLVDEIEAAAMLSLSVRTLQSWRLKGGGPVFAKLGRVVRYRRRYLISFIDEHMASSTSQIAGPGQ